MKKSSIWERNEKVGEMIFDVEAKLIRLEFEEDRRGEYIRIFRFLIGEIRKKAFSNLVFDENEGMIKNVDEMVLLAIKQELFLNLIELKDEEEK